MNTKPTPFTHEFAETLAAKYPTPFYLYDEKAIRLKAREFRAAFDWVPGGFKNFFAVKALPNPHILKILREEGMGADCSSLPELILEEKSGLTGEDIIFTSNDTTAAEFVKARELGARTIAMVGQVAGAVGAEAEMCVTMPDSDPARVQEHHLAVLHVVCRQLDAIDLGTRHEDDQRE